MTTILNIGPSRREASNSEGAIAKTIITKSAGIIHQPAAMVRQSCDPIHFFDLYNNSKADNLSDDMPSEASATSVSSKETRSKSRGGKETKG